MSKWGAWKTGNISMCLKEDCIRRGNDCKECLGHSNYRKELVCGECGESTNWESTGDPPICCPKCS